MNGASPGTALDDLVNDPKFKDKLILGVTETLFFNDQQRPGGGYRSKFVPKTGYWDKLLAATGCIKGYTMRIIRLLAILPVLNFRTCNPEKPPYTPKTLLPSSKMKKGGIKYSKRPRN